MDRKRGQAALEFLATYSWAFIVILVVIGAMAYFFVSSPGDLLPERCQFSSELECQNHYVGSNGVMVQLKNVAFRKPLIIDAVEVTVDGDPIPCQVPDNLQLNPQEVEDIPAFCDFASQGGIEGDQLKSTLSLTYHEIGAANFQKTIYGEVVGKVQDQPVSYDYLGGGSGGGALSLGTYDFNTGSGSVLVDIGGTGNNGTITGDVDWAAGKYGQALEFNGNDGYVELNFGGDLAPKNLSLSYWIYPQNIQSGMRVYSSIASMGGAGSDPDDGFHYRSSLTFDGSDRLVLHRFSYSGGCSATGNSITSTSSLSNDQWYHVAETVDHENELISLYINGQLQASDYYNGTCNNDDWYFWLGRRKCGGGCSDFEGRMDSLSIYNRVLTQQEITLHANS